MKVGLFFNQVHHLTHALSDLFAEQQSRHQGFERGMRVCMIDAVPARRSAWSRAVNVA